MVNSPMARTKLNGKDPRKALAPDAMDSWRVFRIMAEFVEGFDVMAPVGRAITIYGSARTKPEDPDYKACETTARLLAQSGFAIITGGGPGIMEAGNKGAFEAGGTSVGLNISLPHEQEANKYQTISVDFHYFYARKVMLVKYASGFIYFPGGFGTLDEFYETMTLIQTTKMDFFPIVLYGSDYWKGLIDWMSRTLKGRYIDSVDLDIFKLVDSPQEAVAWIKKGLKRRWWHPADVEEPLNGAGRPPIRSIASGADTGEGTRYGRRPRRTDRPHAKPSIRPQA